MTAVDRRQITFHAHRLNRHTSLTGLRRHLGKHPLDQTHHVDPFISLDGTLTEHTHQISQLPQLG